MSIITIPAEPQAIIADLNSTAVIIIDIEPCKALLAAARKANLLVIHTREGHRTDMSDAPPAKVERGDPKLRIGADGPMGRILISGEPGQDIIPELYPIAGEPVIDKPGKGAFYATDLQCILLNRGVKTLIICGVTTEICVHTTVREANDRGYRCVIPGDCCASYFPEFHDAGLRMIKAQGGILGWVTDSTSVLNAIQSTT
jgi:biuret amidohydrolase